MCKTYIYIDLQGNHLAIHLYTLQWTAPFYYCTIGWANNVQTYRFTYKLTSNPLSYSWLPSGLNHCTLGWDDFETKAGSYVKMFQIRNEIFSSFSSIPCAGNFTLLTYIVQ